MVTEHRFASPQTNVTKQNKPGRTKRYDCIPLPTESATASNPHTMIAAEVAKTLIVQREATVWSSEASKIPGIFAEAVCSALVERNYFAKARQSLISEGVFANYEAATQWQTQLEESLQPQLTTLAARLEKHPDGKGLWAPNRRVKKERTSDLLEENLLPARTSNQPSVGTSR